MRRPAWGTNNEVLLLRCGTRELVWRRYQNLAIEQVRREHRLLARLTAADLPFSVPSPLRTGDGDTLVPDGTTAIELHDAIPGRRPQHNSYEIALVAAAFGLLRNALADLPRELAPYDWSGTTLAGVHPDVPDPTLLTDELAAHGATATQLRWWASALEQDAACVAAQMGLPTQLIHGDVALSNALIAAANIQVTGLLDFEISGWDTRVADFSTGLATCCGDPWTDDGPARIRAFTDAHLTVAPLTEAELSIVPDLVRGRLSGSVVWRAGRARRGLSTWQQVLDQLHVAADHEAYLDVYRMT